MKTNEKYLGIATYSPEDNKLRMYAFERLDAEVWQKMKKIGFKWAPKQKLFVAPRWTPAREDLLLELCGDIEDEDQSPEDRAADRAERFAMYRDKRRDEAHGHADNFDNGPAVHGYQSQAKADREAKKQDRQRVYAFTQWDKAEYWQTRTKAVIAHALYKERADVRRGRILTIEKDKRKLEKDIKELQFIYDSWMKVKNETDPERKHKLAVYVSGIGFQSWGYIHPRNTERKTSLYYLLTDEIDPITADEAVELFFKGRQRAGYEGGIYDRCLKHYDLRLAYEKQMIEADGGQAGAVEMVPGGFIGNYQIHKVHKSNVTGQVVSVSVMAPAGKFEYSWQANSNPEPHIQKVNIQRCGESIYTPPTAAQLKEFEAKQKEQKAINKVKNAGAPKLINPDRESAERLQKIWNNKAKAIYDLKGYSAEYKATEVKELTQAQYSARSKGAYSYYSTVALREDGHIKSNHWQSKDDKLVTSCKVRQCPASASFSHAANCVILITDKPQGKLPKFITTEELEAKTTIKAETVAV